MRRPLCALISCLALCLSCDKSDGGDPPPDPGLKPSNEDVVDVTDLLVAENSGSGAIDVGDPAELLGAARKESIEAVARLRSVLQRLKDAAGDREPGKRALINGLPYGVWDASKDGIDLSLFATVVAPDRIRYLLLGKKTGDSAASKPLLTGVFVKKSPRKGGGRLHLNLTNISDLGGGGADGVIWIWWSNAKDKQVARRVLYRNVKDRAGSYLSVRNYGMDYLRQEGVGGRFRTMVVGDLAPKVPGDETLAVRVLWNSSQGGRGDAVLFGSQGNPALRSNECWDKDGNRTAHKDDIAANDADNPDAGDTSSCWGFAQDQAPDSPYPDSYDADPVVADELTAAGATDVTEADASYDVNPGG